MTEENDTQWHIDAWRTKYEALLQERVAAEQGRWREVASLTHQLEQAVRERDEARAELVFLRAEYGDADANTLTRDALELMLQVMDQRDEARAEVERLRERIATQEDGLRHGEQVCARLVAERDEARAEVEVLRRERDEARRDLGEILAIIHRDGGHYTGEHGISKSVKDAHAAWAAMMREIDKLRAERRLLRDRLVACLPFVGICPREPDRIQLMRLVRDLAEEVLEEVQ